MTTNPLLVPPPPLAPPAGALRLHSCVWEIQAHTAVCTLAADFAVRPLEWSDCLLLARACVCVCARFDWTIDPDTVSSSKS